MFKRKNLVVLAALLVLSMVLAACGQLVPSGIIQIDPETGAGTASFTMVVPKNGAPDVGNNFIEPNGDSEPNNTAYIKNPTALLDLAKANVPEGFEVSVNEVTKMVEHEDEWGDITTVDEGSFDYTVTFSFNDVDDFNAKIKQWLPQQYWDAAATVLGFSVKEATLADGVLTVDMHIMDVIGQWAYTLSSTDTTGAVVDGGSGFDYSCYYNMDKATLTLKAGSAEVTERYDSKELSVSAGSSAQPTEPEPTEPAPTDPAPADPAPTGPAPTDPAPTEPAGDQPADAPAGLWIGIAVAVIAVVVVVLIVIKKKK